MVEPRHYEDQIALSLYRREIAYDTPIVDWTASGVSSMQDFSNESSHELWDDTLQDDDDVTHNTEYPLVQEIVRQSVSIPYAEPRTKPDTLAGLLGLALGSIISTQDGSAIAWRHAVLPVNPTLLPSMSAMLAHMHSSQYLYSGLKAASFTLRNNGAYLAFDCPLLGSGTRSVSSTAFPAPWTPREAWLRWGDCHLYLLDVTGAPPVIPDPPLQGSPNLGIDAIDISTRVLRMEITHPNNLWAEGGYRPSTRMVRGMLVTAKRSTELVLELQVDTANEARDLTWYLQQHSLAFELQCVGEVLIDPAGTFFFGVTIILPRLQLRAIPRSEEHEFDTLELQGRVMDDQVNPVILGWVYNARPVYLSDCVAVPPALAADLTLCLDLHETSGTRYDSVGATDMTSLNSVGSVAALGGTAAHFEAASFQSLTAAAAPTIAGPFTLAFWLRPGIFPVHHQALLSQGATSAAGQYQWLTMLLTDGHMVVAIGGVIPSSTAILVPGIEYFVLVWHDEDTLFLQVNNGAIDSAPGEDFVIGGGVPFNIGAIGHTSAADHDIARQFFNGDLNRVMLFDRALTDQSERDQLWNNGRGVRCLCP